MRAHRPFIPAPLLLPLVGWLTLVACGGSSQPALVPEPEPAAEPARDRLPTTLEEVPPEPAVEEGPIERCGSTAGFEYQVRLDPARLAPRSTGQTALRDWLDDEASQRVPSFDFDKDDFDPKKRLQEVLIFDTPDGLLAARGWVLRRRDNGKTADLTLKANGPTPDEAAKVCFGSAVGGLEPKVKLEQDVYADPALRKWAYSARFESKDGAIPPVGAMNTLQALQQWFPEAAAALGVSLELPLVVREVEHRQLVELKAKLDGEELDMELVLPYRSPEDHGQDVVPPVDPELSWKLDARSPAADALLGAVAEGWGVK